MKEIITCRAGGPNQETIMIYYRIDTFRVKRLAALVVATVGTLVAALAAWIA